MARTRFSDRFSRKADMIEHLQDRVENLRWELAHMIWEENQAGTPFSAIGESIGKSTGHSSLMARCWANRESRPEGETFNSWYNRLKKGNGS